MTLTTAAREQADLLTAGRNVDGGWGYARGRASRLEPTSFALLALAAAGHVVDASVLDRWPRPGGLLIDPQSQGATATENAIALIAAQRVRGGGSVAAAVAPALARMKGTAFPPAKSNRQDNAIQGWPWVANTFSWVEPTAWSVLALARWSRTHQDGSIAARIVDGQRLLIDRVCTGGGWNYGNSNVLGKELFAYVPTTAVALLALQHRRDHEAVTRSRVYLSEHCLNERSGLSLSLARIALSVLAPAEPPVSPTASDVAPRLESQRMSEIDTALSDTWRSTGYLGNLAVTALALYAIAGVAEDHAAFRV